MTPYSLVSGYKLFGGSCCLHFHVEAFRWWQHIAPQTWCLTVRLNDPTNQNSVITNHTSMLVLKSDSKIMTVILTKQSLSEITQPDFIVPCSRVLQFRQGFEYSGSASTKKDVARFIECRIKDTPFCYKLWRSPPLSQDGYRHRPITTFT